MNRLLPVTVFAIVCCQTMASAVGPSLMVDVIPLSKGLHNVYSYQAEDSWKSGGPVWSQTDSGTVEYTIEDSVDQSDTLRMWLVRRKTELLHRHYTIINYSQKVLDAEYAVRDTTIETIVEVLRDFHELRCASSVWQFPLRAAHSSSPDSTKVERYASSSSVVRSLIVNDPKYYGAGGLSESIWCEAVRGVTRLQSSAYVGGGMSGYTYTVDATLIGSSTVAVRTNPELPLSSVVSENFPNPFNPSTTIRFSLPQRSQVSLTVFNALGQQVAVLVEGEQEAGYHDVRFNGSGLSSGVYFYRIQVRSLDSAIGRDSRSGAGSFVQTRTLLLLR